MALLAPGVNGGAAGFGGISFGGSSVAENAVYVNGLNVTDFYNRVGFSAAPFAFYQEFQVKTGGYSVEFGRTTGGIINAVSRSGSNDFHFGAEATLQPKEWESPARDRFDGSERYYTASQDTSSLYKINAWASGPIIRDRLFFFLMAEGRDARSDYTTNGGATMNRSRARNPFWGGKLDWNITGNHTVSLMGFTDESDDITSPYAWDFDTRTQGAAGEPVNSLTGGRNWNATYTGHFGDAFTARVMYGKAARNASTSSAADMECNTVVLARTSTALPRPGTALGCVGAGSIFSRLDERTAKRVDFEWVLGSHQLRFGADHETNVSDHAQRYRGPGGYRYDVYASSPGEVARGPQILPPGYAGYVRQRRYEVAGLFESINSAFYLEDNWQISQRLMLNFGIRSESFDNLSLIHI